MRTSAFLLSVFLAASSWAQTNVIGNKIGDRAPLFQLEDENSIIHSLSDYKGKVVLLDFWASWCGPCIKSLPSMQALYSKYNSHSNFEIVSVSVDVNTKNWRSALKQYGPTWTNLCTSKDSFSKICGDYNVMTVPKLYLIDQEGIIVAKNINLQQADKFIGKLLNQVD